ncbi:ABC transporter substrate-binding protein [Ramlibacter albus]|uniref:ABC transporter substrate-binding protein n=1 Tax=Ramlibacter albus TaxID=2079448 RepID=A0A923MBF3_9BURK|nr:ABC transporter substrate-binding protein [Ramlibacter albus]MBC5766244.1 ABC transporter substrate-binding protein [Ramlibacter albus]
MAVRVLSACLAAGATRTAWAQGEPRRVGWLVTGKRANAEGFVNGQFGRLASRGWRLGTDLVLVPRFAENDLRALPALARELVATKPDIIVTGGSGPATAALGATRSIPIVVMYAAAPVEVGLVESLSRPGGNLTGTSAASPEFAGKLLDVLRSVRPSIERVAILRNPDNLGIQQYTPHAQAAAQRLGLKLHYFETRQPQQLRPEELDAARPDAIYVINDFVMGPLYATLARFALERRILSIGVDRNFVRAGGLLSLGPDQDEMEQVLVDYVDRILRGASPAVLPVREPTRFNLTINRRTAAAVGVTLTQELLLRAHEVLDAAVPPA